MHGIVCARTWIKPLQKFHCTWSCIESCLLEAITLRARVVHSNSSRQVPHTSGTFEHFQTNTSCKSDPFECLQTSTPCKSDPFKCFQISTPYKSGPFEHFQIRTHVRVVHSNASRQVKYHMDAVFHVSRPWYAAECVPKMKGRLFFLAGYLITHHDVVLAFWHIRRSQTQIFIRNILTTNETNPRIKEPVAKPWPPSLGFQNPCGKRKQNKLSLDFHTCSVRHVPPPCN